MTDMPPPATSPASPPRRWMRWVLGLSLALNLAVAGLVLGAVIRQELPGPRDRMVRDLGFGPFSDALSDADRKALRRAFFEQAPDFRKSREDIRSDMAALLAVLRAEPFDAATLQDVIQRQTERINARQALGRTLILDRIEGMTPQERADFADRLEDGLSRRGAKKR